MDSQSEIQKFTEYKRTRCAGDTTVSCSITPTQIDEISYFLAHTIPKHNNIELIDIKNGKILGRGGFGYSYITKPPSDSGRTPTIIKIAVCPNSDFGFFKKVVYPEIDVHSKLIKSGNKSFIKLYGYYFNTGTNYKYINVEKDGYCIIHEDKGYIGCEAYIIIEAGLGDLDTYIKKVPTKLYTIDTILNLVNFYKVSEYFLKTEGKIFIHNDIKVENIVYTNDTTFKLIDFGLCDITTEFFQFNNFKGTPYFAELLFNNPKYSVIIKRNESRVFVRSPMYDMFSICISIFEVVCNKLSDDYKSCIKDTLEICDSGSLDDSLEFLIRNLLDLCDFIYKYHQNRLHFLEVSIERYQQSFNLEDTSDQTVDKILTKYRKVSKTKTEDDYMFFDNIVQHFVNNSFSGV